MPLGLAAPGSEGTIRAAGASHPRRADAICYAFDSHTSRCCGEEDHHVEIVLYRRRLSLTSGAGQLIRMQAEGLRAAGHEVAVTSRRGRLGFFLRSGLLASRATTAKLERHAASPARLLVDHGMEIPQADLLYVHNLLTGAVRYLPRDDWAARAAQEAEFFARLRPEAPVIANSELVKRALVEHFSLDPGRVLVHYPGFDARRFIPAGAAGEAAWQAMRRAARGALGVADGASLVGLITSGELDKRGLDIFVEAAERILAGRPETRFLVVGGRALPEWAARHRLVTEGQVLYRPKSARPERWFAALDLFLFPARWEEFGMVVSEAQAAGLPVLTSRRAGAAECLPEAYAPWLLDEPGAAAFAANALALLADEDKSRELAAAGLAGIAAFDRNSYVRRSVGTIARLAANKQRAA